MKRKYQYTIILISFLWWTKKNDPYKYQQLEDTLKDMPLNVVLELIDSIIYYRSKARALKVYLGYVKNKEELVTRRRVDDLAQWARTWRQT